MDQSGGAVGKINDLLFDPADNEVRYALADLNGGRQVMVPIGQIALSEGDRRATAARSYTRDRLMSLRAYDGNESTRPPSATTTGTTTPNGEDTDALDYRSERYRGNMPLAHSAPRGAAPRRQARGKIGESRSARSAVSEQVAEDITL